MEIIGAGLEAIGCAIGAWATAYGFIYCIGFIGKTFLIYMDKARPEELKNWFDIWRKRDRM